MPGLAATYHNLGHYLHRHARQPAAAVASHLAAALIGFLAAAGDAHMSVRAAARALPALSLAAPPPCRPTWRTCAARSATLRARTAPSLALADLIAALSPDPERSERILRTLIELAQAMATRSRRRWWPRRGGRHR